jgi:hypothetical protein
MSKLNNIASLMINTLLVVSVFGAIFAAIAPTIA